MRTQLRNRQTMFYATPNGTVPVYQRDDDGNIQYITVDGEQIPVETGEYEATFSSEVEFRGAIFSQLENAIVRAWGNDSSYNYAVLVTEKDAYPEICNGTRIWRKSKVSHKTDGTPDESGADYYVSGVLDEELNETSYYLTVL